MDICNLFSFLKPFRTDNPIILLIAMALSLIETYQEKRYITKTVNLLNIIFNLYTFLFKNQIFKAVFSRFCDVFCINKSAPLDLRRSMGRILTISPQEI